MIGAGKHLINVIAFYIGWLLCVMGGAIGKTLWPTLAALTILGGQLLLESKKIVKRDLFLILFSVIAGFFLEVTILSLGILKYASPNSINPIFPPYWLITLYPLFAMTINHSLSWIKRNIWLAAFFGAFGGPFSYLAGNKLGGIVFLLPKWQVLLALGVLWAFFLPILTSFATWLDQKTLK